MRSFTITTRIKWLGSLFFGFATLLCFSLNHASADDIHTYNDQYYPEAAYVKGVTPPPSRSNPQMRKR